MCAVTNGYWNSANSGSGMITATTTGDSQTPKPVPMPGSSVGAIPAGYRTSAQAVYPVYDGVTEVSGVLQTLAQVYDPVTKTTAIDYSRYPASFWSDLDLLAPPASPSTLTLATAPADFTNWHSAFQAEFIVRYSDEKAIDPPAYQIGSGSSTVAIFMLDDDNRPVNLLSLTLSDYGKLSDAEKIRFNAKLTSSGHLENLGLSTSNAERALLLTSGSSTDPGLNEYLATISGSGLTAAQKLLFSAQIQMLKDSVTVPVPQVPAVTNELPAFNAEKIKDAAGEVMARFKIVEAFVTSVRSTAVTFYGDIDMGRTAGLFSRSDTATTTTLARANVNSLDGGARMDEGVEKFLRAETVILNMKQRREVIAQNSAYRDPNLDVPNLIFQLQLLYEAESEGVVDAGTEEFRQLHKLLEDYNVMQQLLSTTIAAFDTGKTDDKRRFMNIGVKDDGEVDDRQNQDVLSTTDLIFNTYSESYNGTNWINTEKTSPLYHWSVLANYSDNLATMHRDFVSAYDDANIYEHEGDVTGKLTRQQMLAFSMFADEVWAGTTNRAHPIEELYGAERPSFDLIDEGEEGAGSLSLLSKNAFDQYQTQISNTITILNQQNQIKQNDVENATKQQNRHFELGSNALRKMNDLLLMIGRS